MEKNKESIEFAKKNSTFKIWEKEDSKYCNIESILKPIEFSICFHHDGNNFDSWKRFQNKEFADFEFICLDGNLYYSKFMLRECEFFAAMFRINKTETTMQIAAKMETVGRILYYLHTKYNYRIKSYITKSGCKQQYNKIMMNELSCININLEILQLAHFWNISEIVKYIYSHIKLNPDVKYLEWEIYFSHDKFLKFAVKLMMTCKVDFKMSEKYKAVEIFKACCRYDPSDIIENIYVMKNHGLEITHFEVLDLIYQVIEKKQKNYSDLKSLNARDDLVLLLTMLLNLYNEYNLNEFNSRLHKVLYALFRKNSTFDLIMS